MLKIELRIKNRQDTAGWVNYLLHLHWPLSFMPMRQKVVLSDQKQITLFL